MWGICRRTPKRSWFACWTHEVEIVRTNVAGIRYLTNVENHERTELRRELELRSTQRGTRAASIDFAKMIDGVKLVTDLNKQKRVEQSLKLCVIVPSLTMAPIFFRLERMIEKQKWTRVLTDSPPPTGVSGSSAPCPNALPLCLSHV